VEIKCTSVSRKGKKSTTCKVINLTAGAKITYVQVKRGEKLFAHGSARVHGSAASVVLRRLRRMRHGRYTVTVSTRVGHTTQSRTFTLNL
jgi:hypothetical protein